MSEQFFRTLAKDAAARYPANDRFARHFAYGKLTGDPAFRCILARGVLLLRVADASASLRFRITVAVDRIVMRARGHRLPRLWCRPLGEWMRELEALGFAAEPIPMSAGTPFANVLLRARYDGSVAVPAARS